MGRKQKKVAAAVRSKKRREQRSAELPRTSICAVCGKPANRSEACTNCMPNGRDLVGYCSRKCREEDFIHARFCSSIFFMDKKRPSEDHYLAAFFPCDKYVGEVFWMYAHYEDGCLEIHHDRPNMLEYIREFGQSSLCHRVQGTSPSSPNTFVAVTGEREADETDPIPRQWINRSRLAVAGAGFLKYEFYPTLLYAVERNEQGGIISPADLSMRSLHYVVVAAWCGSQNQSTLPTYFDSLEGSVPAVLVKPSHDQQRDIGIQVPAMTANCLRDRPETTFPLAKAFQIGLPWYIRLPSPRVPAYDQGGAASDAANHLLEYLKYILFVVDDVEIEGQKKAGICMSSASLWPSAVVFHGRGHYIPPSHLVTVGSYMHCFAEHTEEGFRDFYLERFSKSPQSFPTTTPWATDTQKEGTVSRQQDQPDVDFWLKMVHGTSLVPDLMAKIEDPFVPEWPLREAELLERQMGAEALLELSQQESGSETETEVTDGDTEGQGRPETEANDENAENQPPSDTGSETLRGSSDWGQWSDNEDDKGQKITDGDAEGRKQKTEVQTEATRSGRNTGPKYQMQQRGTKVKHNRNKKKR